MSETDAAKRGGQALLDVSIVIPTFNRAGLVERAVESALSSSPTVQVEIVVIDDGSTDDTLERLKRFGGRIVVVALGRNRGRNHARNAGLRESRGEWLKFLDSDDVLEAGTLAQEVVAGRESDVDIVATSWREGRPGDAAARIVPVPGFRRGIDSVLAGEAVPTSAALYRRAFIASLKWDTSLSKLDDWDFFTRAFLDGARLMTLPVVSYTWVSHPGQGVLRTSLLANAREHHAILRKIESRLSDLGQLTDERKRRLAQYFYKELRVLSLHDRAAFEGAVAHILELDRRFQPRDEERQWWMRALARAVGFRNAVRLHSGLKKVLRPA